jgi:hypothetical protein
MLTSNRMDPLALIQHDRKLKEQVRFDEWSFFSFVESNLTPVHHDYHLMETDCRHSDLRAGLRQSKGLAAGHSHWHSVRGLGKDAWTSAAGWPLTESSFWLLWKLWNFVCQIVPNWLFAVWVMFKMWKPVIFSAICLQNVFWYEVFTLSFVFTCRMNLLNCNNQNLKSKTIFTENATTQKKTFL